MTETPAQTLRRAAEKLRQLASDATPGPWQRPLNVRNKAVVTAPLPEGEQDAWISGIDPDTGERERCAVVLANTWSNGRHMRRRSGRDLEYIAAMHPGVGLLIADTWDEIANVTAFEERMSGTASPGSIAARALTAARAVLGKEADAA